MSSLDTSCTLYDAFFPLEDDEGSGTSSTFGAVELGPAVAEPAVDVSAAVGSADVDVTEVAAGGAIMPKGTGKESTMVAESILLVSIVLQIAVSLGSLGSLGGRTSAHRDV